LDSIVSVRAGDHHLGIAELQKLRSESRQIILRDLPHYFDIDAKIIVNDAVLEPMIFRHSIPEYLALMCSGIRLAASPIISRFQTTESGSAPQDHPLLLLSNGNIIAAVLRKT
jgi:hypothetical protein